MKTNDLGDICCYKIQIMKLSYLSENQLKCRNCSGEYYEFCENYKPLNKTQIPFRKGINCYIAKTL